MACNTAAQSAAERPCRDLSFVGCDKAASSSLPCQWCPWIQGSQISFPAYSQLPGGGEPAVLHPDPHCLPEEVSVWDRRHQAVCEKRSPQGQTFSLKEAAKGNRLHQSCRSSQNARKAHLPCRPQYILFITIIRQENTSEPSHHIPLCRLF